MDDPVEEIPRIVHLLTQSSPSIQQKTIDTYYLPNASFSHPFCRTPSFDGSRFLIRGLWRWYKVMSPRVDLQLKSVAYDPHALRLYIDVFQILNIWFFPFWVTPVTLVTVLQLSRDKSSGKYYIASQDDLYQVDEVARFFAFGGWMLVRAWQIAMTLFYSLGAALLFPVPLWEERGRLSSKETSSAGVTMGEGDRKIFVVVNGKVREYDSRADGTLAPSDGVIFVGPNGVAMEADNVAKMGAPLEAM